MDKVRFGVLSTAKIGVEKVIPAMQQGDFCEIAAISSRSKDRAAEVAHKLKIPTTFGSYEELLADPEIDAVYNPLPNHLHVSWTLNALEAGKHVLCEKPIGLSSDEAQKLIDEAASYPDLKVMEAFMYRFHPQWQKAKSLVDDGSIGELRTISSVFSYYNEDPDNIRNKAEMGGGAMMDIGCYCLSLSRFIFGSEPSKISGSVELDPDFRTDRLASGVLEFEDGTSIFTCSTQLVPDQGVTIYGTEGKIEIEIPFNAPPDKPTRLWLTAGGETEEIKFEVCDQYTLQGDAFARAVLDDNEVPTPLTDALNNMKSIEAIFESADKGLWVRP
ncbi:Gfo/Idh/MocA family oxidoreductase [Aliifodinibius sp. S!AR15-10]|uniref:Gfo/Idh/MocA family protein n=1 Tax=Aliifodinibius sp. S!AR15-10 TaxID=2950437 RepID=UPI0028584052|nr:Gfo/Idh/MocA family oxidoreductase [Aliifodinibius sp. S!AR15-10]MDR8392314.1 Gfo/Idh/MocA family oxidoreductase [Aliifodinibius sp. S!AR15-10]